MVPIRSMLAQSGVTEQKWRVLRVLEEIGEVEPTVIASEACLHLPSLSRILKTMESGTPPSGILSDDKEVSDHNRR